MSFFKNRRDKEQKELTVEEKAEKMREKLLNIKDMPEELIVKKSIEMCRIEGIEIERNTDNNVTLARCYDVVGGVQMAFKRGEEVVDPRKPFDVVALGVIKYYVPKSVWNDLKRVEDKDKVYELYTKLGIQEHIENNDI